MKKILIVEDDAILMSTLVDNLSREGFEIIKAGDGQEGLDLALKEKPNLILLDILLPKMDGFSMLKKLRQDNWGKDAAVIILTNLNSPSDISKSLDFMDGFYEYLVKSDWKIEDLINKVRDRIK